MDNRSNGEHIRPPRVAGTFYPADPVQLREMLTELSALVPEGPAREVAGLISPHAGYVYSGQTAAQGFAQLRGRVANPPDACVVISPSHREYFRGCSIFSGDADSTPLGALPVHDEIREALLNRSETGLQKNILSASNRGHGPEHALEVQLPFLQFLFGEIPIVPIVMGDQAPENCFGLGQILADVLRGRDTVIIASTDLSHFHPSYTADTIDAVFLDHIRRFDETGLMQSLEMHRTEACGGGPTVAAMTACRQLGASKSVILDHRNSGAVTRDLSSVVGYLSAALTF